MKRNRFCTTCIKNQFPIDTDSQIIGDQPNANQNWENLWRMFCDIRRSQRSQRPPRILLERFEYMFEFPSATQRPAVRHDWLLSFGIDETEAEIEPDYPAEDLLE